MTYAILLISPGRWLQAKTQQPIDVVGLVMVRSDIIEKETRDQNILFLRASPLVGAPSVGLYLDSAVIRNTSAQILSNSATRNISEGGI